MFSKNYSVHLLNPGMEVRFLDLLTFSTYTSYLAYCTFLPMNMKSTHISVRLDTQLMALVHCWSSREDCEPAVDLHFSSSGVAGSTC